MAHLASAEVLEPSASSSNLIQGGRTQLRSTAKKIFTFLLHIKQREKKRVHKDQNYSNMNVLQERGL